MNKRIGLMSAAGFGAALMYLFDPDRGKKRRALVRNKLTHAGKVARNVTGKTGRDVRNHVRGILAGAESLFRITDVSDDVLEARVHSKLGRVVSHPAAIEAKAVSGLVILTGPILASEEVSLLESVAGIHGVKSIENHLELHQQAADIPALQGGRPREGERYGILKTNWSPTTRFLATAAGGAMVVYAAKRRGAVGSALGSLGLGMVMRALTNFEIVPIVGLNGKRNIIEIEKTINIDASLDQVFTYWSHPQNFPDFMSHVQEVSRIGDGLYRWRVGGPGGIQVEWDAQITDLEFNKLLAWKSLPGAIVEQEGVTKFSANPDGSTRIDVKMRYSPPAGVLGHKIAKLFGVDPKHEMDDDLMRMKSFIETGKTPHDAWSQLHPNPPVVV
jgi:uncharacterized membrane protein